MIPATVSGNVITFETDEFSTYALAYSDTKEPEPAPTPEPTPEPVNPDQPSGGNAKTGDENNLALWISLMAGALLLAGGAAVVIRRKKKAER